eukprot:Lithocolla_globosa_v1_NODE_1156_length_2827_cov_9.740260.p2 type:complete len:183 gc:universal NODE_1156_length_2827_cov_9.740260:1434-886(-)
MALVEILLLFCSKIKDVVAIAIAGSTHGCEVYTIVGNKTHQHINIVVISDVMNTRIKQIPTNFVKCVRTASASVMLFQNQNTLSSLGQHGSAAKTTDSRANYNGIKLYRDFTSTITVLNDGLVLSTFDRGAFRMARKQVRVCQHQTSLQHICKAPVTEKPSKRKNKAVYKPNSKRFHKQVRK